MGNTSSRRALLILLVLVVAHTLPLWNTEKHLVGGIEDPAAQAAMPGWYCDHVLAGDLRTDRYLAPAGVSLANNYDSPFPMILTCPLRVLGSHAQFHIFAGLNVLFLVVAAWMVAGRLFPASALWQLVYAGAVWWSGFYVARVHQHYTLLAGVWGFQLLLWMFLTVDWRRRGRVIGYGILSALIFAGTIHNLAFLSVPFLILLGASLRRSRPLSGRGWVNLGLAGCVGLAVFVGFFWPSLWGFWTEELLRVPADRARYNFDLLGPFVPWAKNLLYRVLWFEPHPSLERYNAFDPLIVIAFMAFLARGKLRTQPFFSALVGIAIFGWLYSLGPEFRFAGQVIAPNPLDGLFAKIPPLSISRTPARFALLTYMAMIFLVFAAFRDLQTPRWIPSVALVWIFVTGPVLNGLYQLPTVHYRAFLPMPALEEISRSPSDTIVVNVPTFFSGDPSQNFLQLFHERPITAGYLSYLSYTPKNLSRMAADPLLSQMNCPGHYFAFQGTGLLGDERALREHLLANHFKYFIVNKLALVQDLRCAPLEEWARKLTTYSWVRVVQESRLYFVLEIR